VQFILQCMSMIESAGIGKLISSIPFNPEGGMSGLDPDLLWELTLNLVTRHCELVTAGHEQVGRVQAYAQDPTFTSFSWSAKVRALPLHASRATTALPREGCGEGHRIGTCLAGAAQGKVHLRRLDPRMAAHALFRCATRA